jgi:hypothetical protein
VQALSLPHLPLHLEAARATLPKFPMLQLSQFLDPVEVLALVEERVDPLTQMRAVRHPPTVVRVLSLLHPPLCLEAERAMRPKSPMPQLSQLVALATQTKAVAHHPPTVVRALSLPHLYLQAARATRP